MEVIVSFLSEYEKLISTVITILAVLYGYVQRLKRKWIEEQQYRRATRLGNIECGFTAFLGPEQKMELIRPRNLDIEQVLANPRLRKKFLAASNDPIEQSPFGNIGFLRMEDAKQTKAVMLCIRAQYEGILGTFSVLSAAGVPSRKVAFLIGVRRDSYATLYENDGFQTYRAIAVLKDEIVQAGEDASAWKASKTITQDFQRDRLEHIVQMAALYASADKLKQQMLAELEAQVPEILYQQLTAAE
jgi:hypothetical protein